MGVVYFQVMRVHWIGVIVALLVLASPISPVEWTVVTTTTADQRFESGDVVILDEAGSEQRAHDREMPGTEVTKLWLQHKVTHNIPVIGPYLLYAASWEGRLLGIIIIAALIALRRAKSPELVQSPDPARAPVTRQLNPVRQRYPARPDPAVMFLQELMEKDRASNQRPLSMPIRRIPARTTPPREMATVAAAAPVVGRHRRAA